MLEAFAFTLWYSINVMSVFETFNSFPLHSSVLEPYFNLQDSNKLTWLVPRIILTFINKIFL